MYKRSQNQTVDVHITGSTAQQRITRKWKEEALPRTESTHFAHLRHKLLGVNPPRPNECQRGTWWRTILQMNQGHFVLLLNMSSTALSGNTSSPHGYRGHLLLRRSADTRLSSSPRADFTYYCSCDCLPADPDSRVINRDRRMHQSWQKLVMFSLKPSNFWPRET